MSNIVIIGLGATGSVAVSVAARMSGVSAMTLIDPDTYSAGNLLRQAIEADDVGQPKVSVQAARVRPLNPGLRVLCRQERIENVPLGLLRNSIILCCVDNRRARQKINQLAWRGGSLVLDVAINAPSHLRVTVYVPGPGKPCLECAWDQRSYDLLEQAYPCAGGKHRVAPTRAPVELAALAAAYLAIELGRVLRPQARAEARAGTQLMLDTDSYEQHLTGFSYNRECRFDHSTWRVGALGIDVEEVTLAGLFDALRAGPDLAISVEGHVFATQLDCLDCGGHLDVGLRLSGRTQPGHDTCGGQLMASGFTSHDVVRRGDLSPQLLARGLWDVGLREGDVITVRDGSDEPQHLELKGGQPDA